MDERQRLFAQVNDLHHTYLRGTPLETVALRGVSMQIRTGEAVGIIGRTGAGKSTLIQHFNGLLRPRQPGRVIIEGQDMSDPTLDVRALRQRVGLVFQRPEQQLFERLVGDDIAFGLKQLGLPADERRARVRWAMELVGLDFDRFRNRFTFSLSGGEMRRVALAGVLALRPRVLILDEATSGIDPRGRRELLTHIAEWRQQSEVTLIIVSTNMDEIAELVERIYVLDDGRVVLCGTPRQLFADPVVLRQYGLKVPQVSALVHRLSELGVTMPRVPITIAEAADDVWTILNS
jgi:energy-coupling factor transport system ATP-binding protein